VPHAAALAPDSVRRAVADVFARPEYHWAGEPGLLSWLRGLVHRLVDWLGAVQTGHPGAFAALRDILIVVLAALLAHIAYVVWRITRPTTRLGGGAGPGEGRGIGVEDARAHLARAEELAALGRFAEALAHRFMAVVLELDRRGALAFHPSKTPAEYAREVRLDPPQHASVGELVAHLYRHVFGGIPCSELEYREFALAADRLSGHVAAR
jgi:hypothetical protein